MRRFPLALLAAASLAAACSPPSSNDLTVNASVQGQPSMTVMPGTLGPTYQLGFTLSLSLGQLASSDTDVTIKRFSVVRAADQAPIVDLTFSSADVTSKHVGIGNTELINYVFKDGDPASDPGTLDQTKHDMLCSGQVQVVGTVFDGARQETVNVVSSAFVPLCK